MLLAEAGCVFLGLILYFSGVQGRANSICALKFKGSSVDLPCSAKHHTSSMKWYIEQWNDSEHLLNEIPADEDRVTYNMLEETHFTLTIKDLRESDAEFYCCKETTDNKENCKQNRIRLRVTDLQVKVIPSTEGQTVTLMCSTNCALTENPAAYIWYKNGEFLYEDWSPWYQQLFTFDNFSKESFFCAVKGHEDLLSAPVCPKNMNCWSVNYVRRRICALKGSSVNISSEYLHPDNQQPKNKFWYRRSQSGERKTEKLTEAAGRVEYHDNMKTRHVLRIQNLKKSDSAEYKFRLQQDHNEREKSDLPGVFLIVTDLKVTLAPSAVVTEGQRVTLSCSTSCPLTDNTNYIWYLNSRPLTPPQNQNKHLVLDPVSSQHEGNYSCAVKTHNIIISREQTLTVYSKTGNLTAAAAGVCAVLLVLIPLAVCLWIRRKRTLDQSAGTETSDNLEQRRPDLMYGNISAQSTEQDDHHYSRLHFSDNHTHDLYSTLDSLNK
ncbi:hypothetical protein L3Q82_005479 [Scortum barcoo]|uniref:Uncharacterized protein n=1 Tax=Scortum barcoo TaxID=214431 RepID=A0ACB8VAJ9_9TELE|nr:hypothetical protein L3Q82_005479 [Scortum barcoo]